MFTYGQSHICMQACPSLFRPAKVCPTWQPTMNMGIVICTTHSCSIATVSQSSTLPTSPASLCRTQHGPPVVLQPPKYTNSPTFTKGMHKVRFKKWLCLSVCLSIINWSLKQVIQGNSYTRQSQCSLRTRLSSTPLQTLMFVHHTKTCLLQSEERVHEMRSFDQRPLCRH